MNKFAIGAALAAFAAAVPVAASAQRLNQAVVAVVDTNRIFAECTACRAAQTQLQTQLQQAQQLAQQLRQPLATEGQAIQTAINARTDKRPDAALQTRINALETRQNQANQQLAQRENTLRSTQAHVNQQIGTRLSPIINQIMQQRGATIVIDRAAALAVSPNLDITNDVLAALNQQLPRVIVTPLPQQQQPQQPTGR